MTPSARALPQRDDLFFLLRWLFIAASAALVLVTRAQTSVVESMGDLGGALLLMAAANLAFYPFARVAALGRFASVAALITDAILAGGALAIAEGEPWVALAVGLALPVIGLVRSNWLYSLLQVLVVDGMVVAALMIDRGTGAIAYLALPLLVLAGVAIFVLFAAAALQRRPLLHTPVEVVEAHREAKESRESDRARAHALYDLALALSSTLDYHKILQAAMDAGRIVLRLPAEDERDLRAAVLLIAPDDGQLHMVASRRFTLKDEQYPLPGRRGVIAETLRTSEPQVAGRPSDDPELQYFAALQYANSLLCIPLHSGLDSFGVILYGMDKANAFNAEQVDLMTSIGVQATLALQNALLYDNLLQEKERIVSVEEDARKKLARDLHDGPTQTVSAIAMRVPVIQSFLLDGQVERAADELRKVENLALKTTREIRHMLFTLRPLVLETQGLGVALKQLADKTRETYDQMVEVRLTGDVEKLLDAQQQGVVFYIVEEAVNNARKHAQAPLIVISGGRQGKAVVIQIADNGVGFEPRLVEAQYDQRSSLGMVNMRERAQLLDAELAVDSAPGHGTRVTLSVPVRRSDLPEDEERRIRPLSRLAQAAADRTLNRS
ncbi:MAG: GAF domain-containing sensor histidine kinase [Anaerolineae bacterium]